MARYRILCFDGGGIRGLVSAMLLERIGAALGSDSWLFEADLLAGTSTGALLALGLARGLSPAELRALYEERGGEIFDDSWLDDLADIGKLAGADYASEKLERVLRTTLGEATRLQDLGRRVLVPAFDLDNEDPDPNKRRWKPKIFHNFPGADSDGELLAWKVAMYSTAAPTYFPAYEGYVDGGVFANNPAMCALAQVLDRRLPERQALEDVVLLSIGTGASLVFIHGGNLDWGYAQWAKPLVELIFEGVSDIARYQCEQLLGDRFHRLAPFFPPGRTFALDGAEQIGELAEFAATVDIGPTLDWIGRAWR